MLRDFCSQVWVFVNKAFSSWGLPGDQAFSWILKLLAPNKRPKMSYVFIPKLLQDVTKPWTWELSFRCERRRAEMGELYVGALILSHARHLSHVWRWMLRASWMRYQFLQTLDGMCVLQYMTLLSSQRTIASEKCCPDWHSRHPQARVHEYLFYASLPGTMTGGGCSEGMAEPSGAQTAG